MGRPPKERNRESFAAARYRLTHTYTPEQLADFWDIGKQIFDRCRRAAIDQREVTALRKENDIDIEGLNDTLVARSTEAYTRAALLCDYYIGRTNLNSRAIKMLQIHYLQGKPWYVVEDTLGFDRRGRKRYAKTSLMCIGEAVYIERQQEGLQVNTDGNEA